MSSGELTSSASEELSLSRRILELLLAQAILCGVLSAETVSTGNTPGGSNILFNNTCPAANLLGTTIQGCISTGNFGLLYFDISGDGSGLTFQGSGGQSVVTEENDGPFRQLAISAPSGYSFGQIVLIVNGAQGGGAPNITFTSFFVGGTSHIAASVEAPGSGYFTITAGAGESLTGISFTSDRDLADVRQVRIGGVTDGKTVEPTVPEPSSIAFALLGCGAIALGKLRRRRA